MARNKKRYTVRETDSGYVVLEDLGTGIETWYWHPRGGGYVYDVTDRPGTLGRQVCDGLESTGSTLSVSEYGLDLLTMIRQEARKAYADGRADDMQCRADED